MRVRIDDRTKEELQSHRYLITATDTIMSGWGLARDGKSKVAWACKQEHVDLIDKWVRDRGEMKYVGYHIGNWYPKNYAHLHIYVVNEDHPALD